MAIIQAKKFDELQEERKQNFLSKLDRNGLTDNEITKMCDRYFPKMGKKYGYVLFDESFRSPEIRWYKRKN